MKKYFDTKAQATKALSDRKAKDPNGFSTYGLNVYKMPKGTRNAGKFAVCTHLEWVNTY